MAFIRLLVTSCFVAVIASAAFAADQPQKDQAQKDDPFFILSRSPEAQALPTVASLRDQIDRYHLPVGSSLPGFGRLPVFDSRSDVTCLTMRTYMVKQDKPGSDSVHPVGYTDCQQADQYQVKRASPVELLP
jgi:hypothetical protein